MKKIICVAALLVAAPALLAQAILVSKENDGRCAPLSIERLNDGSVKVEVMWSGIAVPPQNLVWDFAIPFVFGTTTIASGGGVASVVIPARFLTGGMHMFKLDGGCAETSPSGLISPRPMTVNITFTAIINGREYTGSSLAVSLGTKVRMDWNVSAPDKKFVLGGGNPIITYSNFGAAEINGSATFIAGPEHFGQYLLGARRGKGAGTQTASTAAHLYVRNN